MDPLPVSPMLPPTHWAVAAAWRAEALGLVSGYLPAQRSVPRMVVARALREAAYRAASHPRPGLAEMTRGWYERFVEEFPEADVEPGDSSAHPERLSPVRLLGGSVGGRYVDHVGRVSPGKGLFGNRQGPADLPELSQVRATGTLAAALTRFAVVEADPSVGEGGAALDRWEATVGFRSVSLSVGRETMGYGPATSGGVVLTGATLPRVELQTTQPFRFPWLLRYLGPASGEVFVTRLEEPRHPGRPYFFGMRGAIQPHPRLDIGINRASVFGGDSIGTPVTFSTVGKMFLGILSADFENQVVSADVRYRAPTESVIPVTLYMEWGAEDASGAWWREPGRIFGLFVPAVPGVPQLALGVERTGFAKFCCGNPPWYLHLQQPGGWASGIHTLGHPLGGEGWEWMGYARAELMDARLRLGARAFTHERTAHGYDTPLRAGNQFAPEHEGRSSGLQLDAAMRVHRHAEASALYFRDQGHSWNERRFQAGLSLLF
ncbi:MAG TPA: capsule assembly Wzi family protein [Longimicrobiaceae bacterium]|nr:capsule assembly Wzi family protein [Longimicrobiaceae bacterium]